MAGAASSEGSGSRSRATIGETTLHCAIKDLASAERYAQPGECTTNGHPLVLMHRNGAFARIWLCGCSNQVLP